MSVTYRSIRPGDVIRHAGTNSRPDVVLVLTKPDEVSRCDYLYFGPERVIFQHGYIGMKNTFELLSRRSRRK